MINQVVKTPEYFQYEAAECGAVCLQIILAYYGSYQSIEHLRECCATSRDGVSAENIVKAASMFGLQGQGLFAELAEETVEQNLKQLCEVPFPYIIFWDLKHFVVLEGIKGQTLYINDPAIGRYTLSYDEFSKSFTGVVISFTKTPAFKPQADQFSLWDAVKQRLQPFRSQFFMLVLFSLLLLIPGVLFPIMGKVFIDDVLVKAQTDWYRIFMWFLLILCLVDLSLLWIQRQLIGFLVMKLELLQGKLFFRRFFEIPMSFFEQRLAGDLAYRLDSINRISEVISVETALMLISFVNIGFYFIVMLLLSPIIAVVTLMVVLLEFFIIHLLYKHIGQQSKRYLQRQSNMRGMAINGLRMIKAIRMLSDEHEFFRKLDDQRSRAVEVWQSIRLKSQLLMTFPQGLMYFNVAVIILIGLQQIFSGQLTVGSLVALSAIAMNFRQPTTELADMMFSLKQVQGDLARVNDIFNYPRPPQPSTRVDCVESPQVFQCDHLTYGYNRILAPVLEDISLQIRPGKSIAIVGVSGSGKSTLIKCLTGLYQPWAGRLCVDDIPLVELSDSVRHQLFGVVSQDVSLFSGCLRDNLSLWDEQISDEAMIEALKLTCVYDEVIDRGGLDAPVDAMGNNFSGGQVQRIELARALLHRPKFLLLDEATSALDVPLEQEIMHNITATGAGVVLCAHRANSIALCDYIIVLDKGRIVESGTHQELLSNQANYYHLIHPHGETDA